MSGQILGPNLHERKEGAMRHKRQFNRKPHKSTAGARRGAVVPTSAPVRLEPRPPKQYGKPFVLLEDTNLNTFEYVAGAWIPYGLTIAQCRHECLVKELPQKVNGKTRYEVRNLLPPSA
jgi:hypothetical protein